MAGSEEGAKGSMPSGVDCRESLKCVMVEAGLPRELGMVMAAVMRAKLGWGDGTRGRVFGSCRNDMAVVVNEVARRGCVLEHLHGAGAGRRAVKCRGRGCK